MPGNDGGDKVELDMMMMIPSPRDAAAARVA